MTVVFQCVNLTQVFLTLQKFIFDMCGKYDAFTDSSLMASGTKAMCMCYFKTIFIPFSQITPWESRRLSEWNFLWKQLMVRVSFQPRVGSILMISSLVSSYSHRLSCHVSANATEIVIITFLIHLSSDFSTLKFALWRCEFYFGVSRNLVQLS